MKAWRQTFTGRAVYPLAPKHADFCVEDIAHALSNICRFGGHCREFYSVAEHSVLVSQICDKEDALWGLLHDASEAYLGDIVRPLKYQPEMQAYRELEIETQHVICEVFGLHPNQPPSVTRADNVALATEGRDLMSLGALGTNLIEDPLPNFKVYPLTPRQARQLFLDRYRELKA
jgi:hypothetical protein